MIKTGVYGRRNEKGQVHPVAKGGRVTLSDEEAARLVAMDVASYVEPAVNPLDVPHVPPCSGLDPEDENQDTSGGTPPAEAATEGDEAEPDGEAASEVARLERMQRADLEQMAADMGLDFSGAKNKHDLAVLISAADEPEDGDAPLDLGAEDIVQ